MARGISRVSPPTPEPSRARFARSLRPSRPPAWLSAAAVMALIGAVTIGLSAVLAAGPDGATSATNRSTGTGTSLAVLGRHTEGMPPIPLSQEGSPPRAVRLNRALACEHAPVAAPAGSAPVWCGPALADAAPSFSAGPNRWADDFGGTGVPAAVADRPGWRSGYFVYDNVGGRITQTEQYRVAGGWAADVCCGRDYGGTLLRPDRSFRFVDGRFVIEADVSTPDSYGNPGAVAWPELALSTEAHPANQSNVYAGYGNFAAGVTLGCNLPASRSPVCYLFRGKDQVWMVGGTAQEAATVTGGGPWNGRLARAWHPCPAPVGPDTCFNRFRLEVTATRLTLSVNGVAYMQATFRPGKALPRQLLDSPVHAYFDSVVYLPGAAVRFHWKRLRVNP
jgi:hypothetical protein